MSLSTVKKGKSLKNVLRKSLPNTVRSKKHKQEGSKQIIQAVSMLWRKLFSCIVLHLMESIQRRWEAVVVVVAREQGPVHEAVGGGDGNKFWRKKWPRQ